MRILINKYIILAGFMLLLLGSSFGLYIQVNSYYSARFSGGSGTFGNPYTIATASDLLSLAQTVNNGSSAGYYGMYFVLQSDIDLTTLSGGDVFVPIGSMEYPFKGNFDGNGHSITIDINTPNKNELGVFGATDWYSSISNLSVYGNILGGSNVGSVVGYSRGVVRNCFSYVSITNNYATRVERIGGVVGYNEGTVVASGNSGSLMIGWANSAIVGGVAGLNLGTVENSYNNGIISSDGNLVGGIVGYNDALANIKSSFNAATVGGDTAVGGIAGQNKGYILAAYNTAEISGVRDSVGGIVGSNLQEGRVSNIFNIGYVIGARQVGGLVGLNVGQVWYGYVDGNKVGGSLVNGGIISECYALDTLSFTQSDVLNNSSKAQLLQKDDGQALWAKRDYSSDYAYYPELKFFLDNTAQSVLNQASEISTRVARITIGDMDVSLSQLDYMYSGLSNEPQVYFGNLLLVRDMDYTVVYHDNIDYGIATASIIFINYFAGTASLEFYINIKPLAIKWDDSEFVYNGQIQHPVATITGQIEGEDISYHYEYSDSVSAGTHVVRVVLDENYTNANYQINGSDSREYVIKKAVITLDWDGTTLIYNGQRQNPYATTVGNIQDEIIELEYSPNGGINVGSYTISARLVDNATNNNYFLDANAYEYNIAKRPIDILLDDTQLVYNGQAQYPKVGKVFNVVDNHELVFEYSQYHNNINANEQDEYIVQISFADIDINANYLFEPEYHHYSIMRKELTIEFFDDILYYTGQAKYPNFFVIGNIGLENIAFDISDFSSHINASDKKEYSITIALSETKTNSNYYFDTFTLNYDIQRATLSLNDLEFASATFLRDNSEKSIFITNLPIGVAATYSGNNQKFVGEYEVRATLSVDDNYNELTKDTLVATMYIAEPYLVSFDEGVALDITSGDIKYGSTLAVKYLDNNNNLWDSKVVLRSMDIGLIHNGVFSYFSGEAVVRIRLDDSQISNKALKIAYIDAQGNKHYVDYTKDKNIAEFEVVDCRSIFVEGVSNNPMLLMVGGAVALVALVATIVIIRMGTTSKSKK